MEVKDFCNPLEIDEEGFSYENFYHLVLKILAFLFSSFLAYYSVDALDNIDKGMYYHMYYAEHLQWLNQIWLRLGFSINLFVAILAIYGSFLVIYFSTSSLDMVLNSVALFFIVELDDLLVRNKDYQRILKYIKQLIEDGKKIGVKKDPCCKRLCKRCCNRFVTCVGWIYTLPFQIFKRITVILCMIIPFFIAYCF